jgi:crotonobetainyl-CoA:carnitine CoA-transferase CaiB-like acyl-CoA transferase
VQTLQQTLDHPQVAAMHLLREVADFPGLQRPARVPDLPIELTVSGGGITHRPPRIGEHTDEILSSLGYSAAEIADLRASGVT